FADCHFFNSCLVIHFYHPKYCFLNSNGDCIMFSYFRTGLINKSYKIIDTISKLKSDMCLNYFPCEPAGKSNLNNITLLNSFGYNIFLTLRFEGERKKVSTILKQPLSKNSYIIFKI
ncbi:MAG: hypothetical protein LBR79_06345, partial [Oscillospiraceae bacterium]|nr:hypothetical protein [Oscillospiraceae bacterium]